MNKLDRFFIGLCSKTTQVMLIQIVEHTSSVVECMENTKASGWCYWVHVMESGTYGIVDNIIVRYYLRKAKIKNTERNILKTAVDDTRWLEE